MRNYKGRDVLVGAVTFLLAVSLAGCCRDKNDDDHSLSLLGGVNGGGISPATVGLGSLVNFRVLSTTFSSTASYTASTTMAREQAEHF